MMKPLYKNISQKIFLEIKSKTYPPGSFLPSERELQDKYKASRITIRSALKELETTGAVATKKGNGRIVCYSGNNNITGGTIINNKKMKIALVVSHGYLPAYNIVINVINTEVEKTEGIEALSLHIEYYDGIKRFEEILNPESIDAIIAVGIMETDFINAINSKELPVVYINNHSFNIKYSVTSNHFAAGEMAADLLLKNGYIKPVVLTVKAHDDPAFSERIRGFVSFYEANNHQSPPVFTSPDHNINFNDFDSFFKKYRPDSTFLTTVYHANFIIDYFHNRKLTVPKTGFIALDNISFIKDRIKDPSMAPDTVAQPWEEISKQALSLLKSVLAGQEYPEGKTIFLRPYLQLNGGVALKEKDN